MASFNKVVLVGNLTRDPELRYSTKGMAIAKIGLAINRVFRLETGETREETTFVDVDVFGKTAENVGQYMKKGRPILVEGRLKLDTWDDKTTGQKRSRLGVVAETVQFLGGPRDEGSTGGGPSSGGGGNYGSYQRPPAPPPPSAPPAPYARPSAPPPPQTPPAPADEGFPGDFEGGNLDDDDVPF